MPVQARTVFAHQCGKRSLFAGVFPEQLWPFGVRQIGCSDNNDWFCWLDVRPLERFSRAVRLNIFGLRPQAAA